MLSFFNTIPNKTGEMRKFQQKTAQENRDDSGRFPLRLTTVASRNALRSHQSSATVAIILIQNCKPG